ncbi:MAG: pseudouridine synthase [Planctomycetia bacterium]
MGERLPLERLLSRWRVASRTQAQQWVRAGRVSVAGRVTHDPRRWVDPAAEEVCVDGVRAGPPAASGPACWLLLNKPRGVVSTTHDPEGRPTVMDLVRAHAVPGLAPVGRLDKASAGLLLLTDDARLADRLLDPASHLAKRYRVKVRGRVQPPMLEALRSTALEEDGLVLGPMQVEVEREGPRSCWLAVVLREGKNRQIRRRLEALGLEVEVLVRTAFGPLELGTLPAGAVRVLDPHEVAALAAAVARAGARAPRAGADMKPARPQGGRAVQGRPAPRGRRRS